MLRSRQAKHLLAICTFCILSPQRSSLLCIVVFAVNLNFAFDHPPQSPDPRSAPVSPMADPHPPPGQPDVRAPTLPAQAAPTPEEAAMMQLDEAV